MDPRQLPDLGALKHNGSMEAGKQKAIRDQLKQNGFLCQCGERIADDGVEIFGEWSGLVTIPNMGSQIAAMIGTAAFCSRTCVRYLQCLRDGWEVALGNGMGVAKIEPLGFRKLPEVEWFSDVDRAD